MTPDELDAIRRYWSRDGGMGNERSADDYTDLGCRIIARGGFIDVEKLLNEVDRLTAQVQRVLELTEEWREAMCATAVSSNFLAALNEALDGTP